MCMEKHVLVHKMFVRELNCLKKVKIVFKVRDAKQTDWKCRRLTTGYIPEQLGISVGTTHKMCIMTFAFLRSIVVAFHLDITRPHTAARTVETINQFGWEQLLHPYNPDLVPSDFHLFSPPQEFLCGTKFLTNEVKSTMSKWLKVKLVTLVKGDLKAPFSIATTPKCRGGCYFNPWIALLFP